MDATVLVGEDNDQCIRYVTGPGDGCYCAGGRLQRLSCLVGEQQLDRTAECGSLWQMTAGSDRIADGGAWWGWLTETDL